MQSLASPPASNPRDDVFATLNDAQRAAVEHGMGDGDRRALLVIAGAGSGKTLTLASARRASC
jgi:DNA helicase-2/ATP-dependent DNA helicase PcrA